MIKIQLKAKTGEARVTFSIDSDDPRLPASVVGDFNDWDPEVHPLRRRSNGTASASVTLEPGYSYAFRYYNNDGYFDDEQVADRRPNPFGTSDCLLTIPGVELARPAYDLRGMSVGLGS
jgi:1,4-alpha-glucan branching enzyme